MLVKVGEYVLAGEDGVSFDDNNYWKAILFDLEDDGSDSGVTQC